MSAGTDPFALGGTSSPDIALLAAEQELIGLRAQFNALPAASPDEDFDRFWAPIDALLIEISTTAPQTLAGAAVKLRLLADPNLGVPAGIAPDDLIAIEQVLALVERVAGTGDISGR